VTREQTRNAALIGGVACFLAGGLSVVLRSLGAEVLAPEQTTWLAVLGLMLVAAGAGLRRR
jgi:LPXTG-motif cell wall-anchored protein